MSCQKALHSLRPLRILIRSSLISSTPLRPSLLQQRSLFHSTSRKYNQLNETTANKSNEKNESKKDNEEANDSLAAETGVPQGTRADLGEGPDPRDKQIAELKDHYLRALAEMENLRERTRREIEHTAQFAIQKFAKDLVNTVDVLNLALKSVPDDARKDAQEKNPHLHNLYTGVSLTESDLLNTLKRFGVERMNPLGEKFDPNKHEAIFQIAVPDKEAGTVFAVEKVGYILNGRIIRPAQVGVVKDNDNS
ncbi:3579_t:CDS:2 [Paraglomus brasilianum]|uniref:GrpE protein homolog n=1 Tax=Paraglomus brasilianum TaxID=144538 RepID=A0A9N9A3T9_9GLOM|nr:3579_t:CDS:2 [Paraglomus brasilianum]